LLPASGGPVDGVLEWRAENDTEIHRLLPTMLRRANRSREFHT